MTSLLVVSTRSCYQAVDSNLMRAPNKNMLNRTSDLHPHSTNNVSLQSCMHISIDHQLRRLTSRSSSVSIDKNQEQTIFFCLFSSKKSPTDNPRLLAHKAPKSQNLYTSCVYRFPFDNSQSLLLRGFVQMFL